VRAVSNTTNYNYMFIAHAELYRLKLVMASLAYPERGG